MTNQEQFNWEPIRKKMNDFGQITSMPIIQSLCVPKEVWEGTDKLNDIILERNKELQDTLQKVGEWANEEMAYDGKDYSKQEVSAYNQCKTELKIQLWKKNPMTKS